MRIKLHKIVGCCLMLLAVTACDNTRDKAPTAATALDFCKTILFDRFQPEASPEIDVVADVRDEAVNIHQISILYTYLSAGELTADTLICEFDTTREPVDGLIGLQQFGRIYDQLHLNYTTERTRHVLTRQ